MALQQRSFPVCVVEGNIGAGKSTFLKMVGQHLNVQLVYEPLAQWQNIAGHNLLDYFYKDMQRWSYTFQSFAFITRIQAQRDHSQLNTAPVQIVERSVYTDRYCFARNCYEMGLMSEIEWQLYQQWFSWLMATMPLPDAFIYLQASPDICYDRLKMRNRSEESATDRGYLQLLHDRHEEWLVHKKHVDPALSSVPVLILECSDDFEHNQKVQSAQIEQILTFFENRFSLPKEVVRRHSPTV